MAGVWDPGTLSKTPLPPNSIGVNNNINCGRIKVYQKPLRPLKMLLLFEEFMKALLAPPPLFSRDVTLVLIFLGWY